MAEQNLQKIRHTDQLIFDEDQNLVGIKNPKGHGEDFLPVRTSADGKSLVSGDGTYSLTQLKRGGSILRSGKPWLRQPANTTGMLATSGNATITATTRIPRGGTVARKCIEVTVAAVAA